MQVQDIGPTSVQLERQAWDILGDLSKITTVDHLLLQMRKFSCTQGGLFGLQCSSHRGAGSRCYSSVIKERVEILRKDVSDDARPVSVLYPVGVARKVGPGKVKDFIKNQRMKAMSDKLFS